MRPLSGPQAVRLVAGRELRTRLTSKAFVISNAVILLLIVGGLVLISVLQTGSTPTKTGLAKPTKIGLVAGASQLAPLLIAVGDSLDAPVKTRIVASAKAGQALLEDGSIKVALVPKAGGYEAISAKALAPTLEAVLASAVRQMAVNEALKARNVDAADLAAAAGRTVLTLKPAKPARPDATQRTALALVAVSLLYFQLITNGTSVASGVVEEKTSRVVELLLSTIKPLHLLTGKIVGIGLVGLVQLAAYATAALVAGSATGLVKVTDAAVAVFASTLGWYVLGFLFLGVLYAAAGSMVSRQEDVGSAAGPLSILVVSMFFVAQATVRNADGTLATVMSWIPPYSATLMPLRIASGVTGPGQIVGTIVLMLVTSAALAVVCARIYERSILRTGTRITWKQALRRG